MIFDQLQHPREFELADIPSLIVGESRTLYRPRVARSNAQSHVARKARSAGIVVTTRRVADGVEVRRLA